MGGTGVRDEGCSEEDAKEFSHLYNTAGRLPKNSRNSFVDLQSKKTVKKTDQKNSSFH